MITGVDVVYIHGQSKVRDLPDWYAEVLGLGAPCESGHWHEYALPDGSRFALDLPEGSGSQVERQPVMISFRVDDVRRAVLILRERGVSFHSSEDPIMDVGPAWVATFRDPEGTWLQISQPK